MSGIAPLDPIPRAQCRRIPGTGVAVLTLRLKHEVALTRALRGEGRQEGFLGLFLTEQERKRCWTSCRPYRGGGAPRRVDREPEGRTSPQTHPRRSRLEPPRCICHLADAEIDLLLYAAAPAIDPRFGRVYGFLNDEWLGAGLLPRSPSGVDATRSISSRCAAALQPTSSMPAG